MASRNISTTYMQQAPQTYATSAVAPVSVAAVTVTTTFLDQDYSPATGAVN